jgi:hypothetical protein
MEKQNYELIRIMKNHATVMAFIMEGFMDTAANSAKGSDKIYEPTCDRLGIGVDGIVSQIAEEVALPVAICMLAADSVELEYPGVFMYEVASTGIGGEMVQAMLDNQFESFRDVMNDTGFVGGEENYLWQLLKGFFYGNSYGKNTVPEEVFCALCIQYRREFLQLLLE